MSKYKYYKITCQPSFCFLNNNVFYRKVVEGHLGCLSLDAMISDVERTHAARTIQALFEDDQFLLDNIEVFSRLTRNFVALITSTIEEISEKEYTINQQLTYPKNCDIIYI